jgi:adenylate cyclase
MTDTVVARVEHVMHRYGKTQAVNDLTLEAEAIKLACRALELDPGFGRAASLASVFHLSNVVLGYQFECEEAVRLSRLALRIDDGDPNTLARASLISALVVRDSESALEMADRAVALNPNSFDAWSARGWVYRAAGLPQEAVRSFERGIRMSPIDPAMFAGMGMALVELRRFDEAIVAGRKAQLHNPSHPLAYVCLASAFAHLGRDAEARADQHLHCG